MAAIERLRKKQEPQVSVALLRMRTGKRGMMMPDAPEMDDEEDNEEESEMMNEMEDDMGEDKNDYKSGHCPKCAEYQMLIGESLAYYMKHKNDTEEDQKPEEG